jgi:hypothetical protein
MKAGGLMPSVSRATFSTTCSPPLGSFLITTTANFDAGSKSDTETNTNSYDAVADALQLLCPPYAKDANLKAFWAMDDGSGGTATDKTGVNDGTIVGASWDATGKFGYCLSFNGTTNYVNCGTNASLDITGNVTYSAWLYIPSPLPSISTLMTKGDSSASPAHQYLFYSTDAGAYEQFIGLPNTGTLTGSTPMGADAWHHVAYTALGTAATIYYDGVSDGTKTQVAPSSVSTAFLIGRHSATTGRYFKGKIENVRIYNRALSGSEITTLYNSGNKYVTSGNWTSAVQTMPAGQHILDTTIIYSGVDANNYIDKIEWLVGGVVKATYDTNITSGTTRTIVEGDLTSGTFADVNANFTVKVYLISTGTTSPIVSEISGNFT